MYSVCIEVEKSVDRLALGDRVLLPGRLRVWLPRDRVGSENVLLKEALVDEFL